MSIKVKTGDIIAAVESMAKLSQIEMKFATGLRVAKLLGQMGETAQQFNTKRNALLQKLGIPATKQAETLTALGIPATKQKEVRAVLGLPAEGKEGTYTFTPENAEEFDTQIKEANEVEVEMLGELLKLPDDLVVAPAIVLGIQKFLQDQP